MEKFEELNKFNDEICVSYSLLSSSPVSNRTKNNECITLIWYGQKIEEKQMRTITKLREINDYVLFFSNIKECINYIESIQYERIILVIMCDQSISIFIEQIQAFSVVHSIFIVCSTKHEHHQLKENCSKLIDIFHQQHELIDSIKKNVKLITNQMQTLNFFNQHSEKSLRDLTKESAEFLWFQMFKDVIMQMPRDAHAKQQLVDFCRSYYHENQIQLKSIDHFERTYPDIFNAIHWYTKQSFVYKLINKALRTEDIELFHTLRFFISDLSRSLHIEYEQKMNNQHEQNVNDLIFKLYRGCQLSKHEFEHVQQNIGNLISANGFLSTSRSKDVALMYAGISDNNAYYSVIFEIDYRSNLTQHSMIIADISIYSDYPDEEEILFDLGVTFKIESVEKDKHLNVWIIKLTATDEGEKLAKEYIEFNRKEHDDTNIVITFGKLLIDMGKLDQAQKYFETILTNDFQPDSQVNRAIIYNNLGTIWYERGDFNNALEYYHHAYDILMRLGSSYTQHLAKLLHNIASVMYERKQFEKAREFYLKSLEIDEQLFGNECLKVANTLLNIGLICEDEGELEIALNYFDRALIIQRKLLPTDHVHIATSLNNIGTIYQRLKQYNRAFEYHQQALKMRQKLLPEMHDDMAISFHNIGEVFHDQGQLDEALEYYFKSIEIRKKLFANLNGHINLAMTLRNIGHLYKDRTNFIRARDYYQEALEMYRCLLSTSDNHREIIELNDCIEKFTNQLN